MPFYLAVDFDGLMMCSRHRRVAMIRIFEFFMRVLTVYRFDPSTGFQGDVFLAVSYTHLTLPTILRV